MFFKEQIKKRIKNEKGLTLVELLAVIVILGIIAAIAIPSIGNIIANSRSKAVISDAQNVMNSAQLFFVDNPDKKAFSNLTTLPANANTADQFKEFVESAGTITDITVTKGDGAPNTITFKAKANGTDISVTPGVTLDQLNKAKVEKGVIKIYPLNTDGTVNEGGTPTSYPTATP